MTVRGSRGWGLGTQVGSGAWMVVLDGARMSGWRRRDFVDREDGGRWTCGEESSDSTGVAAPLALSVETQSSSE